MNLFTNVALVTAIVHLNNGVIPYWLHIEAISFDKFIQFLHRHILLMHETYHGIFDVFDANRDLKMVISNVMT